MQDEKKQLIISPFAFDSPSEINPQRPSLVKRKQ